MAGVEPPAWPDDETSFAELAARVDKAMEYLRESLALDPNQKDARELLAMVSRAP